MLYLRQHLQLRWEITNESARRKEILELPEAALREALVNALCHRDYFEEGAQVTVEIFDDRVEIYNPGGLAKGLKPEEFGSRSVCRNPLIASLLLRCNYIEKLGTGIKRIRDALAEHNCPDVKAHFNTMFTLEFLRPTYKGNNHEMPQNKKIGTLVEVLVKTQVETPVKTPDLILQAMNENPVITMAQIAKKIPQRCRKSNSQISERWKITTYRPKQRWPLASHR